MNGDKRTFVVWMHRSGVTAVAHFADREMAEEYAAYFNRRQHTSWFEVRSAPATEN